MKNNGKRLFALLALCLLCGMLFLLPAAAQDASLAAAIEEEVPGFTEKAASVLAIDSLEDANVFMADYSVGILFIVALIALVVAFFGYRALHFAIMLGGFSAGWALGAALYSWIAGAGLLQALEPIPAFVPYIIFAVFGAVGAFLAMRVIRVGIFLAGAAATYFFLNSLPSLNGMIDQLITEDLDAKYMIVRVLIALFVGVLALLLKRPVLILATGAAGGMIASIALMVAVGQTANVNLELAVGLVLAAIGVIVQFTTGRRRKRARR